MIDKKQKKSKIFTTKMQKKLLVTFLLIVAFLVVLIGRLFIITFGSGKKHSQAVYDNFAYNSRVIPSRRGDITDRNGTVMAYSSKVYNLILDAKVLLSSKEYREPTVKALLKYFPLDADELNSFIDNNAAKKAEGQVPNSYKRLLTTLTEEEIAGFLAAQNEKNSNIKGVWFEEEYKRLYPYNTLAADVIGFSSATGGGQTGLEKFFNDRLAGIDGREYGYIDNNAYSTSVIGQVNGDKVVSTIDVFVQNVIEEELRIFNKGYGCESASILVMDPDTGEIYGMCDYPTYDLNNPSDLTISFSEEEIAELEKLPEDERMMAIYELWSAYGVHNMYEPGSVFKTFTIATALEEALSNSEDVYVCDGVGIYDSSKILCHGGEGHGDMSLGESLALSCNDALMQIAMKEGVTIFSKYIRAFNFGESTDVELPFETDGLLISPDNMMDVDLVTNSFGQNLNVTMVQTAAAFASVINGGYYYKPHIVKEIQNSAGEVIEKVDPELVGKTVSAETSKIMRSYLRSVVDYGTGYLLYRDGYSIGGKTGTAEKHPRDKQSYIVSFMSFAPAEDPEMLVYVIIDSPNVKEYDSSAAAQLVAANIMDRLMPYFGVEKNNPDYEVPLVHVNSDPEKKNGEILVTSDGIIVSTGERLMITKDEAEANGDYDKEPEHDGEDSDDSENVETPEVPETPETPDMPETPETPDMPETPEIPETPDMPEAPGAPETPDMPEVPDNAEGQSSLEIDTPPQDEQQDTEP